MMGSRHGRMTTPAPDPDPSPDPEPARNSRDPRLHRFRFAFDCSDLWTTIVPPHTNSEYLVIIRPRKLNLSAKFPCLKLCSRRTEHDLPTAVGPSEYELIMSTFCFARSFY